MADAARATLPTERVGMWERDLRTGEGRWDPVMYRLYEADPAVGAPSMDDAAGRHFHPDDVERSSRAWRRSTQRAGRYGTHFRLLFPDGRIKHLHSMWEVVDGADGRPERAVGVLIDDTESVELAERQHEAEARLAVAAQRLQDAEHRVLLATEAVGLGVWELDLATGRHAWSAQMYRLRGLTPDDPRSPGELRIVSMYPEDRDRVLAAFATWLSGDVEHRVQYRVLWPDGTVRWLASRGTKVPNAAGQPPRLMGVNWDVTDQVRNEQADLERAAAEQANRAKSQFLARMSHELRTPLNAVLGFAQLLEVDAQQPLSERQAERVRHIRVAGEHLLALINDTLDLASIEAGTLPLADETVPLGPLVDDVLRWIEPAATQAGVSLVREPVDASVRGDGRRVRQVLLNLLSNAVKYNRRGGRVTLSQQGKAGGGCIGIEVADTGRGLTPAQLKRLFEPFDRLGAERGSIEGTGIGLAIVRHLVQHMGGRVDVTSEPDRGTRFTVWLRGA